MSIARIQFLTKTDLGWHIRFTASDDSFWTVVERFKTEQRNSQKINCHWNPRLFDGKGGWFVTDRILLKYQDYFENYAHMRKAAEVDWEIEHQEDLWGETKSERDEQQQEHQRGDWHSSFNRSDRTYQWEASWTYDDPSTGEKEAKQKQAKERERQWKQWEREQQQQSWHAFSDSDGWERHSQQQSRPPARPTSTGLTLSEALIELGFSALDKPTEIEVKKAFRQLAMKKHPDHGGDHMAFIKLNKAYQMVLWSVQGVKA